MKLNVQNSIAQLRTSVHIPIACVQLEVTVKFRVHNQAVVDFVIHKITDYTGMGLNNIDIDIDIAKVRIPLIINQSYTPQDIGDLAEYMVWADNA